MKIFKTINLVSFVIFLLCLNAWSYEEEEQLVMAPMEKAEQDALYSVIQGFVGNWWNGSDLYPDPCGWTPIQGVSCDLFDGLWYVTSLSIGTFHENSLACAKIVKFRPLLFEFKRLKSLSIFNCSISSHKQPLLIPSRNWEKLAGSLESLEFRSNHGLIGQIPDSFGSLMKLQSLVLIENQLTGSLPVNIGNLVNLKRLVLSTSRFTGQIPDSFGGLNQLLILDLSRNALSGPLPFTLGSLTSLLKLDLSNNLLEGRLPNEIGNVKELTLLDLSNNKFSGGLTQSLQKLQSLEEMVLYNNPIGGDLKSLEWQKLEKLGILDLSNTSLNGEIPESISELKRLRFLGLSDNNLSGKILRKLATLPCVGALYLNGNNLTGELQFSEWFYGKMGRRFGAWDNPNLCYSIRLLPPKDAPFGVKPCQPNLKLLEPNSDSHFGEGNLDPNFHLVASLGFSSNGINGFWWGSLVETLLLFYILS